MRIIKRLYINITIQRNKLKAPVFESCVFGSRKWLYNAIFTNTRVKNFFLTSLQVGLHALAKGKERGKG